MAERRGTTATARSFRAVALCAAALAASCGGTATRPDAVASPAWRTATGATLDLLLEDQRPLPAFVPVDGRAALLPVAETSIALGATGGTIPKRAATTISSFWRPRRGLYADGPVPSLAATWLALRGLRAAGAPADPRVTRAVARALAARRTAAGYAWKPGGRTDAVATLYGVRVADVLHLPRPRFAACARRPSAGLDALTVAATQAEIALRLRRHCRTSPPGDAAREVARLRGSAIVGVGDVERIRALIVLERSGALRRGTTRPLVAAVAASLRAPDPPGLADGTVLVAIREGVDIVGRRAILSPHARRILTRTIRFDGRAPELVTPDAIETMLGFAAMRLVGSTPPLVRVDAVRDPLDRAVVALATGRAHVTARDERAIVEQLTSGGRGMRQLAVAALASDAAGPAACSGALRPILRATLEALRRRPALVRAAAPLSLYWLTLLLHGTRSCLPRDTASLDALALARVDALAKQPASAEPLERWWAAEAACLSGRSPAHWTDGLPELAAADVLADGGARSPETGRFSLAHTYALLRLEDLRAGCSPGWWAGTAGR